MGCYIHLHVNRFPHRVPENIALRVRKGFLFCDRPGVNQFLNQGMIASKLLDAILGYEVSARIPDVTDLHFIAHYKRDC
jgi:hypothetical protein